MLEHKLKQYMGGFPKTLVLLGGLLLSGLQCFGAYSGYCTRSLGNSHTFCFIHRAVLRTVMYACAHTHFFADIAEEGFGGVVGGCPAR